MSDFDKEYWDAHYAEASGSSQGGSPHLAAAVRGRTPGTALDAGCGPGSDALWLAAQGWRVTAVDVAAAAVEQAKAQPGADDVTWVVADVASWEPTDAFDVVTSHYVHVPGDFSDLVRRLSDAVLPGGLLLVVGHDTDSDGGHAHGSHLDLDSAVAVLAQDEWEVLAQDRRPRAMTRPDGTAFEIRDVVLLATRR